MERLLLSHHSITHRQKNDIADRADIDQDHRQGLNWSGGEVGLDHPIVDDVGREIDQDLVIGDLLVVHRQENDTAGAKVDQNLPISKDIGQTIDLDYPIADDGLTIVQNPVIGDLLIGRRLENNAAGTEVDQNHLISKSQTLNLLHEKAIVICLINHGTANQTAGTFHRILQCEGHLI